MYNFTNDWFSRHIPLWDDLLSEYKGQMVNVLEIGSFEGMSSVYFLDNILTHKKSRLTCIDTFEGSKEHGDDHHGGVSLGGLYQRFIKNIEATGKRKQVSVKIGTSEDVLPSLFNREYDIVYIDGSHQAKDVLSDLVMSWKITKIGGIIIMDDYLWEHDYPETDKPQIAIDSFLRCYSGRYEIVHSGYQVVVRKMMM
jgi:predicted O-methyltransferase YrrM